MVVSGGEGPAAAASGPRATWRRETEEGRGEDRDREFGSGKHGAMSLRGAGRPGSGQRWPDRPDRASLPTRCVG